MTLQYQVVPVSFAGGLDQKTAEQLVVPGKFLVLENCVRRKLGRVDKRYGFNELSKNIVGGSTLGSGIVLAKLNNDVLQVNEDKIYSYIPSSDQWVDRGFISALNTSSNPIIRNSDSQAMPDIASYNGLNACVWEDSRTSSGVKVSVFDTLTGASVLTDVVVSATGTRPKVVGIGNRFLITYIVGTTLRAKYIETASPTTLSGEVTVDGTVVDAPYDMDAWSSQYAVIAYRSLAGEIKMSYVTSGGILGSSTVALPVPGFITFGAGSALTVAVDPNTQNIYLAASSTSSATTSAWVFDQSLLSVSTVTVDSIDARNLTFGTLSGSITDIYLELDNADAHQVSVKKAVLTFVFPTLSVTTAAATFKGSVGLASKAFIRDNTSFVIATHQSPLQSTYFIVRSDGFVSSRNFAGLGGGLTRNVSSALKSGLPRVTGNYLTSLQVKNSFEADNDLTILSSNVGITQLNITFDSLAYDTAQLGQNLHLAGGILLNYDGDSVTEHGFNLFPENITVTADSGGTLATGIYYYQITYEWIDAKGQIHRSAPSVQIERTVTGASDDRILFTIPTLKITQKTGSRSDVRIVLYRGLVGDDQVKYRLVDIVNNPAAATVALSDSNSILPATLALQQVLYTTGGVIENVAPPSCTSTVLHKNRLWLAGLDEVGFITYSKEFVSGEGVGFSDFFIVPVDPASGNVTALASMDDKLVIFKKDNIYTIVGDGPLDTGAQNDFTLPQLVSGDIGCVNPSSIAQFPDGLLFKSDKGIYMLTRSLEVVYIGQNVEDFNSLTITSAVVLEDINEVRFTTSDGTCLVFNYEFAQWSTFSNYEALSAVNGIGQYLHLKSDGTVRRETPGLYLDAGSKIKMAIETSWLAFQGLQGYQRIRMWSLLGDFITDHYTKVKLYYDYEKFSSETVYFNVDTGLELSYYGDDVTYGDSVVYGGQGSGVFQFSSQPRVQKCQSMKMRIEDIDTKVAGGGGSFNLVSLTLEIGMKNTITKQMLGNKAIGS